MIDKTKSVDAEVVAPSAQPSQSTQALAVRDQNTAVDKALGIDELKANLDFIRSIMQSVMKEGQDYGKIPGCGDKPGLFQPGAQKLCMTFQLTDEVKEERVLDLPGFHREYSFVVRLVSKSGRSWEGVGTCSTLEAKYRYRKAERRCPKCGKHSIIQGKAEFGGGWVCWKKKQGCDAKFAENDPAITSQPGGQTEYENPPDYWNTVRKMAFKRALVHASINATNTSELWSQDLEDLPIANPPAEPQGAPARGGAQQPAPGQNASRSPKSAPPTKVPVQTPTVPVQQTGVPVQKTTVPVQKPEATPESREKMIANLHATPGEDNRQIVTEYFQKLGQLIPTESLEDLPLRFVPVMTSQMRMLASKITAFGNGEPAGIAFEPNWPDEKAKPKAQGKPIEVPRDPPAQAPAAAAVPDEWFMKIVVPIPRKGQKRDEYLKHPDTIGSLYEARHGSDDEAQEARQRLWGFVNHFEPTGWDKRDGTHMPPSEADKQFRAALDAFNDWFEKTHPDEKL